MIIIIEGCDGAGKTTLIESLTTQYPFAKTFHFGAPVAGEDQFLRYAKPILEADPLDVIIYDRSWYSEFVYGPVMRGKYEFLPEHSQILEKLVMQHGGGFVVYATASVDTLWERCTQRGETYITDKETLRKIDEQYKLIMCTIPKHLNVIRWDTEGEEDGKKE